jgi:DNA-binding response OmpR family regulator
MTYTMPLQILLIDDNVLVRDTFLALARFSNPSWEIRTAGEHDAGLDIAKAFIPQVICACIGAMPKPGLSFARNIRTDKVLGNTFLIAITGWGDMKSIAEIDDAGFDVCLTKPVEYTLVTQHIHAFEKVQKLLGEAGAAGFRP